MTVREKNGEEATSVGECCKRTWHLATKAERGSDLENNMNEYIS